MNTAIQFSQFRKLVDDVLNAMLLGKHFTKSDLNSLIPEGMNKSADDIIRLLRQTTPIKISHQRAKKTQAAYWYMGSDDVQAYLNSPDEYHQCLVKQQQDASKKRDRASALAIFERNDSVFFSEITCLLNL
ncbi:hypothetical protein FC650_20050 [Vibrio natriegens]|uniref:hypothetical protein n=1 Tax=Vibrio natriegens TaxID=691 RepID=UPI001593B978|nr:hypothetical protein [Vibrio natriegens]NVC95863.1 hypothetical protein [Vibrio natriegens]